MKIRASAGFKILAKVGAIATPTAPAPAFTIMRSIQRRVELIQSFFQLADTRYAAS